MSAIASMARRTIVYTADIFFGPQEPKEKGNWIRSVPGKGWFPFFRLYSPTEAYFDQTWKLEDIVAVRQ